MESLNFAVCERHRPRRPVTHHQSTTHNQIPRPHAFAWWWMEQRDVQRRARVATTTWHGCMTRQQIYNRSTSQQNNFFLSVRPSVRPSFVYIYYGMCAYTPCASEHRAGVSAAAPGHSVQHHLTDFLHASSPLPMPSFIILSFLLVLFSAPLQPLLVLCDHVAWSPLCLQTTRRMIKPKTSLWIKNCIVANVIGSTFA